MVSKVFIIAAVIAYVEARFGQEQLPLAAISALQGGDPGAASTIAGAATSDLLGGADACAKLTRADQVVSELGGGADAIAAAIGLVAAEKNTNPFAGGNVQNVCGDASLPATPELRGITPLIDPAVDVNGDAAALSASSAANPLAADGLSVFDLMSQAGLGDLVASSTGGGAAAGGAAAGGNAGNAAAGNNAGNAAAGNNNNAAAGNNNNNNNNAAGDNTADDNAAAGNNNMAGGNAGNNNAGNAGNNNNAGNAGNNNNAGNAGNNNNAGNAGNNNNAGNAGNNNNAGNAGNNNAGNNNAGDAAAGGAAAGGAADFGACTPTIFFAGGLGGRPADEFTFQIEDELARGGQGEALNPNIITNALCNQLTNVCDANAAAVTQCEDAQAQVEAAGTRDQTTADLFNSAVLGGAANKKRNMRRGLRV